MTDSRDPARVVTGSFDSGGDLPQRLREHEESRAQVPFGLRQQAVSGQRPGNHRHGVLGRLHEQGETPESCLELVTQRRPCRLDRCSRSAQTRSLEVSWLTGAVRLPPPGEPALVTLRAFL
jgi:hypothetical protein